MLWAVNKCVLLSLIILLVAMLWLTEGTPSARELAGFTLRLRRQMNPDGGDESSAAGDDTSAAGDDESSSEWTTDDDEGSVDPADFEAVAALAEAAIAAADAEAAAAGHHHSDAAAISSSSSSSSEESSSDGEDQHQGGGSWLNVLDMQHLVDDFDALQESLGLEPPPMDREGRVTGVPADVQVLVGAGFSPASAGFMVGVLAAAAPLLVVLWLVSVVVLWKVMLWVLGF
jgi:hypothetical protein